MQAAALSCNRLCALHCLAPLFRLLPTCWLVWVRCAYICAWCPPPPPHFTAPLCTAAHADTVLGIEVNQDGDAARFAARMAERFTFLAPDKLRDGGQRRPDHPDYDPSTLHIPPHW